MTNRIALFSVLSLSVAISCIAADRQDAKPPAGSSREIVDTIESARAKSERRLQVAMKMAIDAIQKKERNGEIRAGRGAMIIKDMQAAQAAWEQYRTKQCAFLNSYYYEEIGSSGARAAGIWEYEKTLIEQRIKELEEPPAYF